MISGGRRGYEKTAIEGVFILKFQDFIEVDANSMLYKRLGYAFQG